MEILPVALNRDGCAGMRRRARGVCLATPALMTAALLFACGLTLAGQDTAPKPSAPAPDATAAQKAADPVAAQPAPGSSALARPALAKPAKPEPCHVRKEGAVPDGKNAATAPTGAVTSGGNAQSDPATQQATGAGTQATAGAETQTAQPEAQSAPCPPRLPLINWYSRFLDGPKVKPMTPKEKAWLAFRNVADPFNGLTILGSSAIAVAANSHSPYGPGMPGFGRYVGVSYTENLTGEFVGTFAISSIMHQDPHYHRMPTASMKRRIAHAFYQVVWTQGDNEKGMPNYANLVGFGIDDAIGNLYVPGVDTDGAATAERYGTALATAPIDNFVSEFLPDVARHIHVQIVVIQRIINQVANKDATGNAP